MKPSNLENHWFSLGKTYILQNRRVLKLVEQVVDNVIKNDAKIHLKTIQNSIQNRHAEKYRKNMDTLQKKVENGARRGPKSQQNPCKN